MNINKKVLLISVDGMRPDGLQACGNPFVQALEKVSLLDITPTVAAVMGITPDPDWKGKASVD